jgi:Serine dehydrogenase proteinase
MKRRFKASASPQLIVDPRLEKLLLHLHAANDVDSFWTAVQDVIGAAIPTCFIVMCEHAVLGPVDPQLGEYPAASILKAAHQKPIAEVDDKTLILADQVEKAIAQMRYEVTELVADKFPGEKAEEIAKLMTSGTWTRSNRGPAPEQ